MKNLRYSIMGQMLLMVKAHLEIALIFMIFFLFTIRMLEGIGNIIFGIVGTLGYFLAIYSAAGTAHTNDKRSISPLTPKPAKGFILPAFLTLLSIVLILLYKIAWTYGSNGTNVTEIWSLIFNIIFLFWVAPYQPFLGVAHGHIEPQGYLIILLLPIIASAFGYLASFKGFDLSEKVRSIAYEKKEKNKDEF